MASQAHIQHPRPRIGSGLRPALVERVVSALVILGVAGLVLFGWINRTEVRRMLDPEHGTGYYLGIIGGTLMLILLGYPLRKRVKKTRSNSMGTIGFWFRLHMFMGLVGPTAILFHSRFSFGSFNSTMALTAMIVVASSGLIGRFFYSRVHRGYSDRKLELHALKQDMEALLGELEEGGSLRSDIAAELATFEAAAISAGSAFLSSAGAVIGLGVKSRIAERRMAAQLRQSESFNSEQALSRFFLAVRRAAEFAFYDRLLRLWHVLHLPLFYILVAAAILHIVAVHMY